MQETTWKNLLKQFFKEEGISFEQVFYILLVDAPLAFTVENSFYVNQ